MTETLIASRNIVVSSSRLGNAENSSGFCRYIVATTTASAAEMLIVMNRSSSIDGSGMISIVTIDDDGDRRDQVGVLQELADRVLVHAAAFLRPAIR